MILQILLAGFLLLTVKDQTLPKWGDVDPKFVGKTVFEKDTTANAVVLCDIGLVEYGNNFKMIQKRHTRILILRQSGLDYANIKLPFHSEQEISKKRAQIFSLDASGKMIKTEVKGKEFIVEKEDKEWNNLRFTFPNVQPGSIIEYEYVLESDNGGLLRDWNFQREIPVSFASLTVEIPNYYVYKSVVSSKFPFSKNELTEDERRFSFYSQAGQGSMVFPVVNQHWVIENLPALKVEPFVSSIKNHMCKITFALQSTVWEGKVTPYQRNWEQVVTDIQKDNDWKNAIVAGSDLKRHTEALRTKTTDKKALVLECWNFVKKELKWNGYVSSGVTKSQKELLQSREGYSGDLALLMSAMLNHLDIPADPVLISTRANGKVVSSSPFLRQFNHMILRLDYGSGPVFLDPTDEYAPLGLMDAADYNEEGLVIKKAGGYEWTPINSPQASNRRSLSDLEIKEDGTLTGIIKISDKGLLAMRTRKKLAKAKSIKDEAAHEFLADGTALKIDSVSVSGLEDPEKALVVDLFVSSGNHVQQAGDMWLITPSVTPLIESTPFENEKRDLPIEFVTGAIYQTTTNVKFPSSFVVEGLPGNLLHNTSTGGQYKRIAQKGESGIQITERFAYNKTNYEVSEYPELKKFFDLAVASGRDQIALKKVAK